MAFKAVPIIEKKKRPTKKAQPQKVYGPALSKHDPKILPPEGDTPRQFTTTKEGLVPRPAQAPKATIRVAADFNPSSVKIGWRPYQLRFINDPSRRRLWVKSAQIGGSTTLAGWSLGRCINRSNHLVIILSPSDRQSQEVALKAQKFVKELAGVEARYDTGLFKDTSILQHTIQMPNSSRIIAIPGKPETARGYTGDIILDEFAFHQNPTEVFTAAYRQVTLGDYSMLIASTPNGQQGDFYEKAKALGLDQGHAPAYQPVTAKTWSGHWTDIYLAVREGLQVNIEELRAGCDSITWSQEYTCAFLSESLLWIPPILVDQAAANNDALMGPPPLYMSNLYAGWDIARSSNRSVIWFDQIQADISICRGVVDLVGLDTPTQIEQAAQWVPQIARMNIDQTGMGLVIAETLNKRYPTKCFGVLFTQATKEAMAVQMKLRLEQRKKRIPNDDQVRRSFLALRRSVNKLGQPRFDSENDERYGHSDEWWAACLADMAAERAIGQTAQAGQSSILFNSQATSPLANFQTKVL